MKKALILGLSLMTLTLIAHDRSSHAIDRSEDREPTFYERQREQHEEEWIESETGCHSEDCYSPEQRPMPLK